MAKINKVLYNIDQRNDTTAAEKKTARDNIGAGVGNSDVVLKTTSITIPPVDTQATTLQLFTDGRLRFDNTDVGVIAPYPDQSDSGKILSATYAGSPGRSFAQWITPPIGLPNSAAADAGKVLTVNAQGQADWATNNKSEVKVFENGQLVHKDMMAIYSGGGKGAKAPITFNNDNSNVSLVKNPADGDAGKVLTVHEQTGYAPWYEWSAPIEYEAGDGIDFATNLSTGDTTVSWAYTVGRNLHINQNNQIQTNLPGGLFAAPTSMSNDFVRLNGADFAGAYRLACRHNTNDMYELAIAYTASGMTGKYTFIGTETVIGLDNSITVNQAAYIGLTSLFTPTQRFGGTAATAFNPAVHKAILYSGLAEIGPTSNTQIAIWQDDGTVNIAMTSIEVGKVGSTT